MKKRILIVALAVGLGSIHACTYEVPVTGQTDSSSSSSSSNSSSSSGNPSGGNASSSGDTSSSSSGEGGKGGSGGQGGMNNGGSGGAPFGEVACGQKGSCIPPTACCTNQVDTYSCLVPISCSEPGQIVVQCDGAEDCPISNCCGQFDGMKYTGVLCDVACSSPKVVICHFDGDKACPPGRTCLEEKLLGPGYGYCGF